MCRKVWFLLLVIFWQLWKLMRRAIRLSPMPAWHCWREFRGKTLILIGQTSKKCLFDGFNQLASAKLASPKANSSECVCQRSGPRAMFLFGARKSRLRVQALPCLRVVLCYYTFGSPLTWICFSASAMYWFFRQTLHGWLEIIFFMMWFIVFALLWLSF